MVPTGVALDRYGVRRTALALLAIGTVGAMLAALAGGAAGMLLAQAVLGVGCSGMLMCPVTFAARALPLPRFALWSGIIQAVGNTGMLLSASPLALLVEWRGWQAGFWASTALAAARLDGGGAARAGAAAAAGHDAAHASGRTRGRCSRSPARRRCGR